MIETQPQPGPEPEPVWGSIDLSGLTLVVGWRRGSSVNVRRVDTTEEVADELAVGCRSAIESLQELERRFWTPEAAAETEEYLWVPNDRLDESSAVLAALRATPYDGISAQSLPQQSILFYAIVVGPPERRVTFLRKYNPRRAIGNRLVTLFRSRLEKLDEPLFIFDLDVDLVLDPDAGLAILSLGVYNLLFKNAPEMLARIPSQVQEVAAVLPMTARSMEFLRSRAASDTRMRRRLESIISRDHLRTVTIDTLRAYIELQSIDPDDYITNNQLDIEKGDVANVYKILNEDLFVGGLSGEAFEAARKSPRIS